jgi:hypothetical protein
VIAQPGHRVGVQVVGGLVEEHGLGVGEQDPGQLDAAPLTAGQGVQRLVQHPVGQAEAGGDRGRLRLGRVPAEDREPFFQPAVLADGVRRLGGIRSGHGRLGGPEFGAQLVEPAGGQHAVDGQHVQVPGARVLRQVPDSS